MLTVTLLARLRVVARSNQTLIYSLLFRTSAAATQTLARDPRFIGSKIGMIGVLQMWARNLTYHPHIHYLVPGGGLVEDGGTRLPSREDFLVHLHPLPRLFQATFRDTLRQIDLFAQVSATVWRQEWVVHCQPVATVRRP